MVACAHGKRCLCHGKKVQIMNTGVRTINTGKIVLTAPWKKEVKLKLRLLCYGVTFVSFRKMPGNNFIILFLSVRSSGSQSDDALGLKGSLSPSLLSHTESVDRLKQARSVHRHTGGRTFELYFLFP